MAKDILFYETRISSNEPMRFIRGRGEAILIERDAYPRSSFARGAKIIYQDRKYKIVDTESASNLMYPPKESNLLCLILREVKDDKDQ